MKLQMEKDSSLGLGMTTNKAFVISNPSDRFRVNSVRDLSQMNHNRRHCRLSSRLFSVRIGYG
jgi:hypothetical protein